MRPRSAALAISAAALGAALALTFDLRRVADRAMDPSLHRGDWVLIGPGEPAVGDVVRLEDPWEPGRDVLRRVLAVGPAAVVMEGGRLRVDGEATRLREMGRDAERVVLSEEDGWLVAVRIRPFREATRAAEVPAGALWLAADDRDLEADSRWWGPVPAEATRGRVWLRLGSSDAWRGVFSPWGRDGPWLPPSRQGG